MTSSDTAILKLQEEYFDINKKGILASIQGSVAPIKNKDKKKDFLHWHGSICGPKNTPYYNGLYYFEIKFTKEYPIKGPLVQMRTKIYHPNINSSNGHICDTYISDWKKEYNIFGIVHAIHDLLKEPYPPSSYNSLDEKKAAEFNLKYATLDQKYDWENCWNQGWDNSM
jgi:ubiquitin-conjugating enzyme E2 D/E